MSSRISGFRGMSYGRRSSPKEVLASTTGEPKVQKALSESKNVKIRKALASNPNLSEGVAKTLANDKNRSVVGALARNPNISMSAQMTIVKRHR